MAASDESKPEPAWKQAWKPLAGGGTIIGAIGGVFGLVAEKSKYLSAAQVVILVEVFAGCSIVFSLLYALLIVLNHDRAKHKIFVDSMKEIILSGRESVEVRCGDVQARIDAKPIKQQVLRVEDRAGEERPIETVKTLKDVLEQFEVARRRV